jgi:hypothetical protein
VELTKKAHKSEQECLNSDFSKRILRSMKRFQILLVALSLLILTGVFFFILQVGRRETVLGQFSSSGTIRISPYQESISKLNNLGFQVVASVWSSRTGLQCNSLQEFIDSLRENSISIVYCDSNEGIAWFELDAHVTYVRL